MNKLSLAKLEFGKRKIIFTFLVLLFSLAAVFVGTYYVVKMRQAPSKSSAGSGVSLYFDPQNPTLDRNSDFTLNVKVNPALERVTGIELYLNFDKDRVILEGIESVPAFSAGVAPKTFLKDPVIDNSQGTASATIGVLPEAPVGSVSDVVIIRGKTKNVPGNTSIVINQDSKAAAIDKTSNVIESYGEATLAITAPTSTPTPTPTPTPTTTPTMTPTSSPTPTPTSSPTLTPTPSPTPTPTPTPGPCFVTTSPAMLNLNVGGTGTVTASVTSGLGTAAVSQMAFGAYNTLFATVNPASDTSSPYSTTVTGVSGGDTAVWGTATLSDGRICETVWNTDTDVHVVSPIPTPTPTPTTTPTVTPTSSPTPTPTSSSTSTPTPSPTATPTPTSSPTPTPTSIPTATPIVSPTGSPEAKAGDVNGDNLVNIVDIGIIIDNYGDSPANPKADLDGDGKVNIVDIGIVIDHYGE